MSGSRATPAAARRAMYDGPDGAAWGRGHRRAAALAWARWRGSPLASGATTAVLALALLLPLLLGLALSNATRLAGTLEASREISLFLAADRDAAAAEALAVRLRARDDVASVALRSPDEGLAEFRRMSDLAASLDLLDDNPLPWVLVVSPRGEPASLAQVLAAEAGVEAVQYDAAWRARLDAWLALARRVLWVVAVLLAAGALLVVGNTVRLDLASRHDEIALLQLLGADAADIRRPLLWLGVLHGAIAAVAALAAAAAAGLLLAGPLDALAASYGAAIALRGAGVVGSVATVAAGALLGWLGARVATGHYLRSPRPADR